MFQKKTYFLKQTANKPQIFYHESKEDAHIVCFESFIISLFVYKVIKFCPSPISSIKILNKKSPFFEVLREDSKNSCKKERVRIKEPILKQKYFLINIRVLVFKSKSD